MKILLIFMALACIALLSGCEAGYSDTSGKYKLPPELADCKIYALRADGLGRNMAVIRCPKSSTTTNYSESCGKGCVKRITTTVVQE